jgi:hypothetical protein
MNARSSIVRPSETVLLLLVDYIATTLVPCLASVAWMSECWITRIVGQEQVWDQIKSCKRRVESVRTHISIRRSELRNISHCEGLKMRGCRN